jgi:hypothetical protein
VAMGRAGSSGVRADTVRNAAGNDAPPVESIMEPHSPQSGHRPSHFGGR